MPGVFPSLKRAGNKDIKLQERDLEKKKLVSQCCIVSLQKIIFDNALHP